MSFGKELNLVQMIKFVSKSLKNIVGKRENAGYGHALIFSLNISLNCFHQGLFNSLPHNSDF